MKKTTNNKKTAAARKAKPTREKGTQSAVRRKIVPAVADQAVTAVENVRKKDQVLALLRREEGATLDELIMATGWQAHSVRGFISGIIRKKLGLQAERVVRKQGDVAYRVTTV